MTKIAIDERDLRRTILEGVTELINGLDPNVWIARNHAKRIADAVVACGDPVAESPELKGPNKLALFIVRWLRDRNGGQFGATVGAMTVADFERMLDELAIILTHNGRPPNWCLP